MPQYDSTIVKSPANSEAEILPPYPWWLYAIVIIGAFLMATGGIIALVNPALLAAPGEQINEAVHIYAGYVVSRNLAIALMLLGTLSIRARVALSNIMILTAFIQFFDAGIDCLEGRWALVPVVTILGIAFLVGAARVAGKPLWQIGSWRNDPANCSSSQKPLNRQ